MNNTSLAIIQPEELDTIQRTGRVLAASGYFDAKGDSAQAIAMMATKIMAGREMGFGPFASVNGIHIIQGTPSVGANLMASAVKSSGKYNYRVREMTNDCCRIEFFEREGDKLVSVGMSEFTKEDAKTAGTQNMTKFARNMLFARAMSNGVRWYCPDVFNGNAVYVPEELGAEVDGDGNVIDTTYTVTKATDATLCENVESSPSGEVEGDVLFMSEEPKRPLASKSLLKKLHAVGHGFYKDKWDAQRPKWVEWASTGVVKSSNDLMPEEAEAIIEAIEARAAKKAASNEAAQTEPEAMQAEPEAAKVTA